MEHMQIIKIIKKLKIKPKDNFSIDVKDFIDWASIQKWKKIIITDKLDINDKKNDKVYIFNHLN